MAVLDRTGVVKVIPRFRAGVTGLTLVWRYLELLRLPGRLRGR
jgi:uncharacterized YccA/Bax inhibitor family protein